MSTLKVNAIQNTSGTNILGTILQVVTTNFTSTASSTSGTPTDVSGFSATITPASSSNRVLVYVSCMMGSSDDAYPYILLKRNGTTIGSGSGATGNQINTFLSYTATALGGPNNYRSNQLNKMILDSPATTSALTYQIALASPYAGYTGYINRQNAQDNTVYTQYAGSIITLMEVSG
jgi:hypothetical protein